MKICMIGDSHLAMMVNAQKEQSFDGLEIAPVSWPRQFFDQLKWHGTEISAEGPELIGHWERSGLPPKIDLSDFDLLVFVSNTTTAFHAFTVLREHIVTGWNESELVVKTLNSPMGAPDDRRLMTQDALTACLTGCIKENHTYKFVDHVRQHCDIPIVVIPAPYLAESSLKRRKNLWGLKLVLRNKDGAALARSLHEAHEIAFGAFSNLKLLRQPEEAIVRGCLTKEIYREGARRFGSQALHGADDILHAGPLLGALWLKEICALNAKD